MNQECCNHSDHHHHDEQNGHQKVNSNNNNNGKEGPIEIPLIEKDQVSSLSNEEKKKIFENCVKNMITLVGEDYEREGLLKTPSRVFHSFESLCEGYNVKDPKEILGKALFSSDNSQMVVIRDIETYSLCEHHLLPVIGKCHVAYIPNGKVVGLSKIPRLVDVYARRLQIQEELTEQIAQAIVETIQPEGVGVVIEARHLCMEMRGVKTTQSTTITSALKGQFLKKETRKEFFDIINRNASNRL